MHKGVPTMSFIEGLIMAMWLVLMGTPNYGVMPGEKAKVSQHSGFYRQGFRLDDACGVVTPYMPSTRSSVMAHLTSRPGQCLFASTNWHSPVCSINSPHGRELYRRPVALTMNAPGSPSAKRLRDILPLHMAQTRSVHMVQWRLRSFCRHSWIVL